MEAAGIFAGEAVEVRERLSRFVEEVTAPFRLRRQRENALLYVRGLVEHGGRKSLHPTLFRLEQTPARYESMQQFLADSPWDPELLVRGCAERVAPELGVLAWVGLSPEIRTVVFQAACACWLVSCEYRCWGVW